MDVQQRALAIIRLARKLPKAERLAIAAQLRQLAARAQVEIGAVGPSTSDFWLSLANGLEQVNAYNPFSAQSAQSYPQSVTAPVDASIRQIMESAGQVALDVANELDRLYVAVSERAAEVAATAAAGAKNAGFGLMPLAVVALVGWFLLAIPPATVRTRLAQPRAPSPQRKRATVRP